MAAPHMPPEIAEILLDGDTIRKRVDELGAEISRHYGAQEILVVGVLNGSFIFMADLVRAMTVPLQVDFIAVSSYGKGTKSSGVVQLIKDLNANIEGRHVLLVEDIVDTGLTLRYLVDNLKTRMPASIRVCALLDKPHARGDDLEVDYAGFPCPDAFVVGYGLDLAGRFRELPYIGALDPKLVESNA